MSRLWQITRTVYACSVCVCVCFYVDICFYIQFRTVLIVVVLATATDRCSCFCCCRLVYIQQKQQRINNMLAYTWCVWFEGISICICDRIALNGWMDHVGSVYVCVCVYVRACEQTSERMSEQIK